MPELKISVKCGRQTHEVSCTVQQPVVRVQERHCLGVRRMQVNPARCADQVQVVLPDSAAVAELQAALVEPSGIMARKQKLIFKGKAREPHGLCCASSGRQLQTETAWAALGSQVTNDAVWE